jgi:tetratricopeptide (TPR) repeat protein
MLIAEFTTEYFRALESKENPQEVIEIINKILDLDPRSATFWFYLGIQYKLLYEFRPAADAFEKSLELMEGSPARPAVQIYEYLGNCYHSLGYFRKEGRVYEAGRIHYPDHPVLIGRQAICYYAQGKIRDADRLLTDYQAYWIDKGRSESEIHHNLGILFHETDDMKAERYFRSALDLDPGNIGIQASLARVLIANGVRMEEAMKILREALEEEPENPELLHLYGWGYFRLEEYTLARDYLLKAEELYPGYNHNLTIHLEKSVEIISIKLIK